MISTIALCFLAWQTSGNTKDTFQEVHSDEAAVQVFIETLAVRPTVALDPNAEPDMGGGVYGPDSGVSGAQGVIFTGVGIDKDDDGAVSEMNHSATFNGPPDPDRPGTITSGPVLTYTHQPTGEKRWEVAYTLVTVPAGETWVRKCEMTLTDSSGETSRIDFPVLLYKLISISGPTPPGGGG